MTRLERSIALVLRGGVTLSSACFAVGVVLALAGSGPLADRLLQVGIVVLLATPVARVVVSVVEYAQQRDWTFTVLTLIVFVELMAGVLVALR